VTSEALFERLRGKERRHLAVVRRLGFDGRMPSLLSGIHEPSRTDETDARLFWREKAVRRVA
jgi:hypothetical protein